jgi:hypothetical protein
MSSIFFIVGVAIGLTSRDERAVVTLHRLHASPASVTPNSVINLMPFETAPTARLKLGSLGLFTPPPPPPLPPLNTTLTFTTTTLPPPPSPPTHSRTHAGIC